MKSSIVSSLSVLLFSSLVMSFTASGQSADNFRRAGGAVPSYRDTGSEAALGAELLIRCDDIGMCHSVNLAVEQLARSGLRFSASVLFVCPWYREAVNILKQYPNVAIGVHLAVNSEWMNYKWGPVAGRSAVPSLVDSEGCFFGTPAEFKEKGPRLDELEKELRAQIERAIHSGLNVNYLDTHMGTLAVNPEWMAVVEKLANEYHLVVSRSLGEQDVEPMYSEPVDRKAKVLMERLSDLNKDSVYLLVCHIAVESVESRGLIDSNRGGLRDVGKNRQAELSALLSPTFMQAIKANNVRLVSYSDLVARTGSR